MKELAVSVVAPPDANTAEIIGEIHTSFLKKMWEEKAYPSPRDGEVIPRIREIDVQVPEGEDPARYRTFSMMVVVPNKEEVVDE